MLSKSAIVFLALPIALAVVPAPSFIGAWHKDAGTGEPLPCAEVKVLHSVATGWPGKCLNLQEINKTDQATCESICKLDAECTVWQYTGQDYPNRCYIGGSGEGKDGFAESCFGREDDTAMKPEAGQRLQHGDVKVITTHGPGTVWVDGLYNTGISGQVNGTVDTERCREMCYSDIHCRYWQYGEGGCWVEKSPDYLVRDTPTIHNGTTQAKTVAAGEIIEHYCESHVKPAKASVLPYIIGGIVAALLIGLLAAVLCRGGPKTEDKPKRTRAVKLAAPKERQPLVQQAPPAPAPAPMPMVVQSYSMLPSYQVQQPMMQVQQPMMIIR